MKLTRTIRIPIKNKEFYPHLMDTLFFYTLSYNYVCQLGFSSRIVNDITLHKKSYEYSRQFLPAQLACSARTKAAETLKSVKSKKSKHCPKSKKQSVRYDKNSYSLFLKTGEISLSTTKGRIRFPFETRQYYKEYLTWKNTSADLILDRKNQFWLHVVFEKEISDTISNGNRIGIDRGINNLAVTSLNKFFNGRKIKQIVNKINKLKSKLQSAADNGSRSAKRHLAKLSGKEKRFRKDVNHCVSKQIISSLNSGDTIVLEDLKGIRVGNRRRKQQRKEFNNWAFYQLDQFLTYKALAKGISIEYADARYTSQGCSSCGYIDRRNRYKTEFCCKKCGFRLHADLNAARNISKPNPDAGRKPRTLGSSECSAICAMDKAALNQPVSQEIMSPCLSDEDRSSLQPCAEGSWLKDFL